jgi:hypothetical protein
MASGTWSTRNMRMYPRIKATPMYACGLGPCISSTCSWVLVSCVGGCARRCPSSAPSVESSSPPFCAWWCSSGFSFAFSFSSCVRLDRISMGALLSTMTWPGALTEPVLRKLVSTASAFAPGPKSGGWLMPVCRWWMLGIDGRTLRET